MWYEILPCFMIMTFCGGMSAIIPFTAKYFYNGTIQGRAQNTRRARYDWDRDNIITNGLARKVQPGLEGLPPY